MIKRKLGNQTVQGNRGIFFVNFFFLIQFSSELKFKFKFVYFECHLFKLDHKSCSLAS